VLPSKRDSFLVFDIFEKAYNESLFWVYGSIDKKHFYSFPRSYSIVVISSANAREPGIGTEQIPSEGT